ncbi:hypothetical protein [Flagellimonas sp. 2504JD4-2]
MKTLKQVFDKHKISVKKFSELTKISIPRVYAYLNKPADSFKDFEVAMLTNLLPVEPDFFGKNYDIFEYRYQGMPDTLISYEQLKSDGIINNYSEFLVKYFERLKKEISKAEESIVVLDYVGDNPYTARKALLGNHNRSEFYIQYESFLREITRFVKRVAAKKEESYPAYIRILQCPIGKSYPTLDFEDKRNVVMDLSYNDMFQQLETLTSEGLNDFAEIYWIENAFRPYSSMIIDNKTVITEQVKYNLRGEPLPDMLFFDYVLPGGDNNIAKTLMQTYQIDIDSVMDNSDNRILRGDALLGLRKVLEKYNNEIPRARDNYEEGKTQLRALEEKAEKVENSEIQNLSDEIKKLKKKVSDFEGHLEFLEARKVLTEKKIGNFTKEN